MTWYDVVALLLIAGVAWLESVRGFGRAIVDLAGGIIAIKLVPVISVPLAEGLKLSSDVNTNRAIAYAVTFVLLGVLVVLVSRVIYTSTLLSLEYLDPIVGAFLGVFSGLIVAFACLHTVQLDLGSTEAGKVLLNSTAGQELLNLRGFHWVMQSLTDLGR